MKSGTISRSLIFVSFIVLVVSVGSSACARSITAAETVEPVREYFASVPGGGVSGPDLSGIEETSGTILTWRIIDSENGGDVEYSWVLAKNTDDLKKAMIVFDTARAWNTEDYIFLPVTVPALEIHENVGLSVPESIYDEDGMNRIREIVMSGEVPEGGFVEQFEQFYE